MTIQNKNLLEWLDTAVHAIELNKQCQPYPESGECYRALQALVRNSEQPCCGEFETCTKPCAPLVSVLRQRAQQSVCPDCKGIGSQNGGAIAQTCRTCGGRRSATELADEVSKIRMTDPDEHAADTATKFNQLMQSTARELRRVAHMESVIMDAEALLGEIGRPEGELLATGIKALIDRVRWHHIESAPRDGSDVLLIATRHQMMVAEPRPIVGCYRQGWWSGKDALSHVTHWAPLPPFLNLYAGEKR